MILLKFPFPRWPELKCEGGAEPGWESHNNVPAARVRVSLVSTSGKREVQKLKKKNYIRKQPKAQQSISIFRNLTSTWFESLLQCVPLYFEQSLCLRPLCTTNQQTLSHTSAPAQQEELKASRKCSREFTETPDPASLCVFLNLHSLLLQAHRAHQCQHHPAQTQLSFHFISPSNPF